MIYRTWTVTKGNYVTIFIYVFLHFRISIIALFNYFFYVESKVYHKKFSKFFNRISIKANTNVLPVSKTVYLVDVLVCNVYATSITNNTRGAF